MSRLRQFLKTEYHKNILTLMSGSILAQLIPVLFLPLMAWLFTPAEFGFFSLFVSTGLVTSVFVCGRYEFAIILPREDSSAINVVGVAILVAFIFVTLISAFLFLVLPLLSSVLPRFYRVGGEMRISIVLLVFFIGLYQASYYWANRLKHYKRLAISRVIQSIVFVTVGLLFGILHYTANGLIIAYLFAQGCIATYLFSLMCREALRKKLYLKFSLMAQLAKRYKNFPLYLSWSAVLQKLSGQLPVFLLGHFFGAAIVGYYALAQRAIQVPVIFIARSVSDVFRQQASEDYRKQGNCVELFVSTFKKLALLVIIPVLVLALFAPYLVSLLFAKEWHLVGQFAQLMSVILLFQFVVSPLSSMFIVAEKQKLDLLLRLYLLVMLILAFASGYYFYHSAIASVLFFVIAYATKYTIEGLMSYRFSLGSVVARGLV